MKDNDVIAKQPRLMRSLMRKYDIIDLITISLFNGLVFLSGLGVGWLIFCKYGVEV